MRQNFPTPYKIHSTEYTHYAFPYIFWDILDENGSFFHDWKWKFLRLISLDKIPGGVSAQVPSELSSLLHTFED